MLATGRSIKIIPTNFTKDEYALKKIIVSSIISDLFDSHNILTFYGSNIGLPLKISSPIITSENDLYYFLESLDKTLSEGLIRLVTKFLKKNIF